MLMTVIDKARQPQHVVVACHSWYGDMTGGSFRLASEFSEHLVQQGHKVSYVCCAPNNDKSVPKTECVNGVNVVRYPPPGRYLSGLARLLYHVFQSGSLARRMNHVHPVNWLSGHSPLQSLGAARVLTKSHFNYTVHSPFDDELLSNAGSDSPGLMSRVAARVARSVDQQNVRLADRVQTVSQYTQTVFRRKYGSLMQGKGMVCPGWVEAARFVPTQHRSNLRHTLGADWETDVPVFFTLRRLENRMGLDTLVDACQQLKADGLEFRTLIGGGGSLREELQQRIDHAGLGENVRLLGRLPEEQLAAAYAAANCFVLPTRALECFGLIVLEAFACNTPVIASTAAAIPELAERQGHDWMFEPGNVAQLADRLRSFLKGNLRPTVNLRDIALEFDKPAVLRRWENLLIGKQLSQEHDAH